MVRTPAEQNAVALSREMDWLTDVLNRRFQSYFGNDANSGSIYDLNPPALRPNKSEFIKFIKEHNLSFEERFMLAMAIAPHIKPELLDVFFVQNSTFNRGFSEFGGVKGTNHGGFLPTGESVIFILSEEKLKDRFTLNEIFDGAHLFSKMDIVTIESPPSGETLLQWKTSAFKSVY